MPHEVRKENGLLDTRIGEILVRYEPGSEVHNAISKARPYLQASVERTFDRLAAQPM
ncbi:metal-dependent phosphohydrolase [Streptomyces sp. SID8381]|nr:metal-dependent phosphohydrolase [Streptomyces sp. SID8381]